MPSTPEMSPPFITGVPLVHIAMLLGKWELRPQMGLGDLKIGRLFGLPCGPNLIKHFKMEKGGREVGQRDGMTEDRWRWQHEGILRPAPGYGHRLEGGCR